MNPYTIENIQTAVRKTRSTLRDLNLEPGNEIWTVKNICKGCPNNEENDTCTLPSEAVCKNKDKKYLEKLTLDKVEICFDEGSEFHISFTDTNGDKYSIHDLGESLFTKREEALAQL